MALKLSRYREYVDPTLTLTVPGRDDVERDYIIPEPSAELGLWCEGVAQLPMQVGEESTPEEIAAITQALNSLPELRNGLTLGQKLMGGAYEAMMADGVSHPTIQHCAGTVYAWIVGGEDAAERFWRRGSRGEAEGPANRAQRRQAAKAASSRTTSTVAAGTTRRRASGSTTKSRKSSGRAAG
jgi:hypothetical protein